MSEPRVRAPATPRPLTRAAPPCTAMISPGAAGTRPGLEQAQHQRSHPAPTGPHRHTTQAHCRLSTVDPARITRPAYTLWCRPPSSHGLAHCRPSSTADRPASTHGLGSQRVKCVQCRSSTPLRPPPHRCRDLLAHPSAFKFLSPTVSTPTTAPGTELDRGGGSRRCNRPVRRRRLMAR